ncbi:MAG: hypothetical protein Ct9H300mP20_17380 [Gammaproteobacteria bacterium]|nr:MAG: hypothetical protein Ct9H300mP20_17380 [Gammaproteobacteria bacterium]
MPYTLMPGDTVPNFNPLVSTDRISYNLDSLPSRPFLKLFFFSWEPLPICYWFR